MSDHYVSRKAVAKSYRPRSYVMSPGLLRARAPFRLQNAITGLILAGFSAAVWAYSISAVKQDDFSDVDEEAKEMMRGRPGVEVVGAGAGAGAGVGVHGTGSGAGAVSGVDVPELGEGMGNEVEGLAGKDGGVPRGVLAPLLDRAFPGLLDPRRKTLIWGAPPLDDLGRMRLRSSEERR